MNTREIFNLTLLTVITSIAWLVVGIYDSYFVKESNAVDPSLTREINIQGFDKDLLNELSKKVNYYK